MKQHVDRVALLLILSVFFCSHNIFSQAENSEISRTDTIPLTETKLYKAFDFVLGNWDFYTPDGTKIGEQIYTKREEGYLILEEWKLVSGSTGLGMSFVDPKTGLWRQVWMSPEYHIDYSGSIDENGAMVLEGTMYPNSGAKSSPIRGSWAKQNDGSIKQEFYVLDKESNTWNMLFAGYTLPKKD